MMLRIAVHEFRYTFWSLQTIVTFSIFFGICFLLTANAGEFQSFAAGGLVFANSPYNITDILLKLSLAMTFTVPPFIASAVLKDTDAKFDPILFSTPISKRDYLCGRFAGAFTALIAALAGAPLGMLLGTFWPWADPQLLGPTQLNHYLVVYFGMIVPTLLVISAIAFAVAANTRSLIHTYVAIMGLMVLYLISDFIDAAPALLDPFMYDVFDELTQYWTATERNQNLISYDGGVLQNRLFWSGLAAAIYGAAFGLFSFRKPGKTGRSRKNEVSVPDQSDLKGIQTGFYGNPEWIRNTHYRQFLKRTQFEVASVLKTVPFMILMGIAVILLFFNLTDREVHYGVNAYPVTRMMVGSLSTLIFALMIVLAFYSAEIIWREHSSKFNEIIDAMPVPNWVFVVSKLIALALVMLLIQLCGIVMAIAIQMANGYHEFQFGLYLERGLIFPVLPYLFLAVLTCFFQVLAKNRYFGMMLFGVFMTVLVTSRDFLGVEHPLLSYGLPAVPAPLSDMNGSSQFSTLGYSVRIYWGAMAGLLLILTYVLWNRGTLQPLSYRLRNARLLKTAGFGLPAALLFTVFLGMGAYIFYNTNILNHYRTEAEAEQLRVDYEKRFRQYEQLPMPRIVDVEIDVDIYPEERRVETRSTHVLMNKTAEDISTVHVVFPPGVEVQAVELEGATQQLLDDDLAPYYVFDLNSPMRPGEKRSLNFETRIQRRGFTHDSPDISLVRNGTFIRNNQIAPHIGFQPDYMLEDNYERSKHGLEPLPQRAKLEDSSQYNNGPARQDSDFIGFETTVSTSVDQTVVAPGYLQNEWVEGDRRYFTYKMDAPIRNFYSYVSADYEVARDHWNDVNIEIFHHQSHAYNVDRMTAAVKDSLDYYSREFTPYQYRQVRILEFPAYRSFAQSFPNTIPYSEDIGFLDDVTDGDLDIPYYVTAHEMAHQWWGHQLTGADVQGAQFLHESLSQYSALLVMEQKYGKEYVRRFLKYELDRYLSQRADDPEGELPLYRVEKQDYIYYRKGSVVMYALRDYLGVEVVNQSLRQLLEQYAYSSTPYAISTNFLDILKDNAGPVYHGLIEDLFEKITLYDIKMVNSQVTELADGRFKVLLDVEVGKFYADETGVMTDASFDVPVDIGLFLNSPAEDDFSAGDVITLRKHAITKPTATIELIVNQKPLFAGIDPYNKLIDRDADDNIAIVHQLQVVADRAMGQSSQGMH